MCTVQHEATPRIASKTNMLSTQIGTNISVSKSKKPAFAGVSDNFPKYGENYSALFQRCQTEFCEFSIFRSEMNACTAAHARRLASESFRRPNQVT